MNSRAKGKRGEIELAKVLRLYGYDAHRGQQYKGGSDSPDVTGIPGYHIEVKRVERLNLDAAMEQSIHDAGTDKPLVIHRKNGKLWKVTMLLEDFLEVIKNHDEADTCRSPRVFCDVGHGTARGARQGDTERT